MASIINFREQVVNDPARRLWTMPVTLVRNYTLHTYYRVTGDTASNITLTAGWQDAGGPQSLLLAGGSHPAGSYTCDPLFVLAVSGSLITMDVTTSQVGKMYVSSTVKVL